MAGRPPAPRIMPHRGKTWRGWTGSCMLRRAGCCVVLHRAACGGVGTQRHCHHIC